jgi:hypothetical protein
MRVLGGSDVLIEILRARSIVERRLRVVDSSHSLELAGAMMAATALSVPAALWIRNSKHYPMPGIESY